VRRALAALAAGLAVLAAGCGGDDEERAGAAAARERPLVVSAAASLRAALTRCSGDARLQFAGSDELAAQIRRGVRPDVFAAANTRLPEELAAERLLERPRTFIGNELVLAVPADGEITGLEALAAAGEEARVAIGAEGVPVGDYTRSVLDRLPADRRLAILGAVRSEEPDVAGVVGKLTQGAVDAGFVYASDVSATDGALRAIELPDALQPAVAYGAGVVRGTPSPAAARRYVDGLARGACHRALLEAGFQEAE
jgi:molybdate transport system substrate-binding protein